MIDLFNIIITSNIKKKDNKTIERIKDVLNTFNTIKHYLKSEIEISKNYDKLLSNSQVLEIEKTFKSNISYMTGGTTNSSYINSKYLEEYQKNLIIVDTIKKLDDKQKKEYLSTIYNHMKDNFIKTNIDFNESETNNTNENGVSLKKEDHTINNHGEQNNTINDHNGLSQQSGKMAARRAALHDDLTTV